MCVKLTRDRLVQVNIDCDFEMTQKTQETRCLAVSVKAFPDYPEMWTELFHELESETGSKWGGEKS